MSKKLLLWTVGMLALGLLQLAFAQSNKESARMFYEDIMGKGNINAEPIKARTGPYRGLPPTGKKVSYTGVNFARYENGVLVKDWTHLDVYGLLVQLGVIPTSGK